MSVKITRISSMRARFGGRPPVPNPDPARGPARHAVRAAMLTRGPGWLIRSTPRPCGWAHGAAVARRGPLVADREQLTA